jgi:hypothetical protein
MVSGSRWRVVREGASGCAGGRRQVARGQDAWIDGQAFTDRWRRFVGCEYRLGEICWDRHFHGYRRSHFGDETGRRQRAWTCTLGASRVRKRDDAHRPGGPRCPALVSAPSSSSSRSETLIRRPTRGFEYDFIGRVIAGRYTVRSTSAAAAWRMFFVRSMGSSHRGGDQAAQAKLASDDLRARMVQEAQAAAQVGIRTSCACSVPASSMPRRTSRWRCSRVRTSSSTCASAWMDVCRGRRRWELLLPALEALHAVHERGLCPPRHQAGQHPGDARARVPDDGDRDRPRPGEARPGAA